MELIILGFLLIIAIVGIIFFAKKKPIVSKIIFAILWTGIVGFGAFISLLMITFSSFFKYTMAAANIFASISFLMLYLTVLFLVFCKKTKALWFVTLGMLGLSLSGFSALTLHQIQDNTIPTLPKDSEIYRYDPRLDNSLIKTLDKEASFKFNKPIYMDGATALYPVYAAFANETLSQDALNDYDKNYLNCSKTIEAYQKIVSGEADVIFVAGASEKQMEYAKEQGVELVFTPIGKEAFVFFVNAKNQVDNLTIEQIQGIYSGQITRWNELGSTKRTEIKPYQRPEGSGSQTALQKLMGDIPIIEPQMDTYSDAMAGIISDVASYKNYDSAIGYSFRFYTTELVKNNDIKLLSINGVYPTRENIINETYPITNTFYAVTRSDASQEVLDFVQWCLSDEGQYLIEETGYVGIK